MRRKGFIFGLGPIIAASLAAMAVATSPASANGWPIIDATKNTPLAAWPIHRDDVKGLIIIVGNGIVSDDEQSTGSGCSAPVDKPLTSIISAASNPAKNFGLTSLPAGADILQQAQLPDDQDIAATRLPYDEEYGWLVTLAHLKADPQEPIVFGLPEGIDII